MAIITKPVGGILKGVLASISLSKSELSALSIIVADSYFSSTSNWNKVILKYRSSTGKQYEAVQFDATLSSPTGNFLVSIKARNAFEIQTIEIHDFDNDIFIVPRSALNVADFDIVLLSAPSSLSYSTPVTYTQNTAITNNVPTVTGTVTSYSILPALPAGLNFNTTTGVISGTPTVASAAANYVVTASNGAGSTTATINITVEAEEVLVGNPIFWDTFLNGAIAEADGGISGGAGNNMVKSNASKVLNGADFKVTYNFTMSNATTDDNNLVHGIMNSTADTGYAGLTGITYQSSNDILIYDNYSGSGAPQATFSNSMMNQNGSNTAVFEKIGNVLTMKMNGVTIYTKSNYTEQTMVPAVRTWALQALDSSYVEIISDTNYINWDLLTGYQAGSLTITPTSGVSGGISLAGDDVAVKSDADKATGDFDYTFKFDWSSASSVNNMFAGVTGNNVTSGTSPLFYDRLTCIYGNGNNPDTANLWHNGSSVGGTTQTLLSGVNTYRLKRVGTTITHYLNDVQIYSATSTSFTAYPSVRTMGNSVVTESYITEAPIAVTWNVAGKTGVGTVTTGANGLITKATGGAGYNVNVLSNETIIGDGYVEFIYSSIFLNVVFGVAEINSSSGFYENTIYGTYVSAFFTYEMVTNGTLTGNTGALAANGDVIRLQRIGTTFSILKNGSVINTGTINNTNPLKASICIYAENFGVNNVTISE